MARGAVVESSLPGSDPEDDPEIDPQEIERQTREVEEPPEEDDSAALEAEARRQGWRPISEYRGDPKDFVGAREFLERGRDFVPFIRKDLKEWKDKAANLESQVVQLRNEMSEMTQLARDLRDANVKAEQRGYDRAMAELKDRQRQAVVDGNVEQYDAAEAEMARLERPNGQAPARRPAVSDAPPPNDPLPPPPPNNQQVDPVAAQWVKENPWFQTDPVLAAQMNAEHVSLKATAPGLSLAENLRLAKEAVVARYPEKFGVQPRNRQRPRMGVEEPSGGGGGGSRERANGINTITDPAERAEARREFERQKLSMPGYTEAQFMKLYNNPRADVLADMQQKRRRERNNVQ